MTCPGHVLHSTSRPNIQCFYIRYSLFKKGVSYYKDSRIVIKMPACCATDHELIPWPGKVQPIFHGFEKNKMITSLLWKQTSRVSSWAHHLAGLDAALISISRARVTKWRRTNQKYQLFSIKLMKIENPEKIDVQTEKINMVVKLGLTIWHQLKLICSFLSFNVQL